MIKSISPQKDLSFTRPAGPVAFSRLSWPLIHRDPDSLNIDTKS